MNLFDVPVVKKKEETPLKKAEAPRLQRTNFGQTAFPVYDRYSEYVHVQIENETQDMQSLVIPGRGDDIRRLVMFGAKLSGKTSTANMILGETKFSLDYKTSRAGESIMHETTKGINHCRKIIKIVETQGIHIPNLANESYKASIAGSVLTASKLLETEPDVFLYIISSNSDLDEQTKIIDLIYRRLRKIMPKIIIIFTGFDYLQQKNISRFSFLENLPKKIKDFMLDCNGEDRVVFFDNNRSFYEDIAKTQVLKLFKVIDSIVK